MSKVKIITVPNKLLLTKCEKVKEINDEVNQNISDLLEALNTAHEPEGAGLAASQIGVTKRICVVRKFNEMPETHEITSFQTYILINPKIISMSDETEIDWEACLSVPNVYGKVKRNKKIKVRFTDQFGDTTTIKAEGFFARTLQHEIDHLDGILFTTKTVGKTINEQEFDLLLNEQKFVVTA